MTAPLPRSQPDIVERMKAYIHGEHAHEEYVPEVLQLACAEIAALKSQVEDQANTIDLLESNARVQAKLLAGMGRRVEELTNLAHFLLDRLKEFDPSDDEAENDFHGHVAPAIARLTSALSLEDRK